MPSILLNAVVARTCPPLWSRFARKLRNLREQHVRVPAYRGGRFAFCARAYRHPASAGHLHSRSRRTTHRNPRSPKETSSLKKDDYDILREGIRSLAQMIMDVEVRANSHSCDLPPRHYHDSWQRRGGESPFQIPRNRRQPRLAGPAVLRWHRSHRSGRKRAVAAGPPRSRRKSRPGSLHGEQVFAIIACKSAPPGPAGSRIRGGVALKGRLANRAGEVF